MGVPCPKGPTRKQIKDAEDRRAGAVLRATHAHCLERESGCCAVVTRLDPLDCLELVEQFGPCQGRWTLAHLWGHRQKQTMNKPPEERHDPAFCLGLCVHHHACEEHRQLRFVGKTEAGMNGPITWRVAALKPAAESWS